MLYKRFARKKKHMGNLMGHFGINRTYNMLHEHFFFAEDEAQCL